MTISLCILGGMLISSNVAAATLFVANLNGAQDGVATPATGFGTVLLNDAQNLITVDFSWTGLIGGPATAAHIHCCAPPGSNGPVLFPFSGVASATSGSIPEQSFAITSTQVGQLQSGLMYMNIHDQTFPGGEIRGQLVQAPEPTSIGFACLGVASLVVLRLRTNRRKS